ncbi:MAG: TolC family outer membrane protein [Pseudomonadota bacterium]|nr:TolC family outer membrane protein [Pseudomonadota bacterium]
MVIRSGLLFGLSLLLAAPAPTFAQPTHRARHASRPHPAASRSRVEQPTGVPHTLAEALAATYAYQPALLAERARLRTTDENVPQALAGWRPTVIVAGTTGYGDGVSREYLRGGWLKARTDRDIATGQATVTQPIYNGGRVNASVNRAKNTVFAERANLIAQEETSFSDAVNAYVGVIEDRQLAALNINNEQVLSQQLRATQDRFRVGEITQTDVAQAQAALATARTQLLTSQGNQRTAEAMYLQVIGYPPPPNLVEPQPLSRPAQSVQDAAAMAGANNPNVVAAAFNQAAAQDAVDVAFAALLPQVSLQGQLFQSNNSAARLNDTNGYQVLAQLSLPLYQGGAEYSAVRAARETVQQNARLVAQARRTAVQNAVQAWQTLESARGAAESSRVAIRANEIAVEGEERQALVGTVTTLDVLIQQQNLLNSRVTLVQNLANLVTASYGLASAIGRLTARDLNLRVPLYDETAYYNEVKNRWFGVGVPRDATLYRR